ncbi:helix-turn-helix domain-containing protein [Niallia endozanthoxylica]|uniref:Helix-turn-helix domain-containing protein n=1 Tax=Niallia endozanthoxylica TaxID=2036016 RepID=A0A5J5HSA1_9BACI|nr:helix-turn-helix domain-containing protein [Niallia endozanthoxylica]KAA9022935.1 helix-turn-helix domain-containing protein [Niallia endozanthoxylica]
MERLNFDTIKHYQSFATIEDMDKAVRGFLYKYKSSLSDGAVKVLNFIWHYSVKVVGVSFAKYDTMAATVGLSRRTVIRAVKVLEELTFIKKIPTSRMNGKQGVNLFVIQPFALDQVSPQDVTHPVTPNKTENKQSSLCENKKQNRIIVKETEVEDSVREMGLNSEAVSRSDVDGEKQAESKGLKQKAGVTSREMQQKAQLNAEIKSTVQLKPVEWHQFNPSFLPEYVNKDFILAAQSFFHPGDIHKLWSKIQLAYKKVKLLANLDDVMEPIIADFKRTVFLYKTGKVHTTFEGYFYRVVYGSLWNLKVREYQQEWYERVMNR